MERFGYRFNFWSLPWSSAEHPCTRIIRKVKDLSARPRVAGKMTAFDLYCMNDANLMPDNNNCECPQIPTIKYEDLLIFSRFCFVEQDSENLLFEEGKKSEPDQEFVLRDETKEGTDLDSCLSVKEAMIEEDFGCNFGSSVMVSCDTSATTRTLKALDIDVALEAACGDSKFLVRSYCIQMMRAV